MSVEFLEWPVLPGAALCLVLLLLAARYRYLYARAEKQRTLYRETMDNLSEGYYRSSLDGRQLEANPSLVRLNGYESRGEMLAAVEDIAAEWYVDPERRAEFRKLLHAEGRITDFVSEIYRHKSRERIWVSENARIVRDKATGTALYYEGSVREVTETVRRQRLEERLDKLANSVPGALFQLERRPCGTFRLPYLSGGFRNLVGIDDDQLPDRPWRFLRVIHPDDLAGYEESLGRSADTLSDWTHEFRVGPPSGPDKWILITATVESGDDGTLTWHGYITDISDRKRAEENAHRLAYYDTLTDLPNRRLLSDRLDATLATCRETQDLGAVLFIDIDNFKILNDTRGHDVGDRLLEAVANKLTHAVRRSDLVARFGGDEFVVVLDRLGPDMDQAESDAASTAENVLRVFETRCDLGTVHHRATPSIGVVLFDGSEDSAQDVLKRADIAMYEAKKRGRNRFVVHDATETRRISDVLQLQDDLKKAIERDELAIALQPIVDGTGGIVGAEAQVCWHHPEHGTILPATFMPLAEQTGFATDIDDWALQQGVRILGRWKPDPFLGRLGLSVNIGVQQFHSESFVTDVAILLSDHRVEPFRLAIEITENVIASDDGSIARRMRELKAMGVRFSLDDFGTGHSSLALLRNYPFHEIKIDGAFIADIEKAQSGRALIEAMLAMAKALRLSTVAEQVSSRGQMAFLQERGCTLYQGDLFGAPMTPETFAELVTSPDANALRIVGSS